MPRFVDADGIAVFVEPPIVVSEKTKKALSRLNDSQADAARGFSSKRRQTA